MEKPILHLTTEEDFYKLQQLLWRLKKIDILNNIKASNAFSLIYDTKVGDLVLTLYKNDIFVAQYHLTFGSELDCNKVWQYFYQPEHRDD